MVFIDDQAYVRKRVAGYVRVSTFEQAEKGTSIDEQRRLILEECNKRGWELSGIYCDEGVSGKIAQRPGLQLLQKEALTKKFQIVMFTKSDRLTRSLRDLSNLWHDWTEAGIDIICIEQPEINSEGLCGRIVRNLLGIFAEWERDTIIERTSSGRMARWRNRESVIGSLPYGYELDKEKRKIIFNPEKKRICKLIFNMYLNKGLNTRDIAIKLTKASIPAPRSKGCRWHYGTIIKILKNTAYAGKAEYNRHKYETLIRKNGQQYVKYSMEEKDRSRWVTINFPPMISKSRFHKVQDIIESRKRLSGRKDEFYEKSFLLENVSFYCGECGSRMRLTPQSKGSIRKYYAYYSCRLHKMTPKDFQSLNMERRRCDMRVDAMTLDSYVFERVMEFLNTIINNARDGLMNLNLQKILERMNYHLIPTPEWISLRPNHDACSSVTDWEVDEIPEAELESVKYLCDKNTRKRNFRNKKRDLEQYHFRLIDRFDRDTLRIVNRGLMTQGEIYISPEISRHIEAISFSLRKRIVESVIASEKGGKCVIKWAGQADSSSNFTVSLSGKNSRYSRSQFRQNPMEIEITFFASPGRIQSLIWGTQGAELFNADSG